MSKYKHLKDTLSQASAEEKLVILRHEMLRPIGVIRGCSSLLKEINLDDLNSLPEDFKNYTERIAKAGDELMEIVDMFVDG